MPALALIMLLTGAGEVQRGVPIEAQPPGQVPVAVPIPAPLMPPRVSRPGRLRDQFADWFTPEDYPAGALPAGGYAFVAFRLAVSADGRVTNCTITATSGSAALDAATCRVLRTRARYRPALDAAGRPVDSADGGGILWEAPSASGTPARITMPAPPPPRIIPPQRARANLNSYFSVDDYPAAALRANHQGTAAFRLTIGVSGRVTACEITASSGSGPLDQATCRILRSRARYTPARDAAGNPAEGRDSGRVTWRLPDEPIDRAGLAMAYEPASQIDYVHDPVAADIPPGAPPPAGPGVSGLRIAIGRDGRVIGCDVLMSSGSAALDAAACRLYAARARFAPGRDAAGAAVCDVQWTGLAWNNAFAGRPPAPPGTRLPRVVVPRPLREQLNARLCPGWPVVDRRPLVPVQAPPTAMMHPPVRIVPLPPPPGSRPRFVPPQRVRANMNSYFSVDDYPAAALRANAEGSVTVRLGIGLDGRITDCVVTGSSGSEALDQATCRILRSRARYYPARDPLRDALFEPDTVRITWHLPSR